MQEFKCLFCGEIIKVPGVGEDLKYCPHCPNSVHRLKASDDPAQFTREVAAVFQTSPAFIEVRSQECGEGLAYFAANRYNRRFRILFEVDAVGINEALIPFRDSGFDPAKEEVLGYPHPDGQVLPVPPPRKGLVCRTVQSYGEGEGDFLLDVYIAVPSGWQPNLAGIRLDHRQDGSRQWDDLKKLPQGSRVWDEEQTEWIPVHQEQG